MPKCLRVTLEQVADWNNLIIASHNAAKSKRHRASVKRYFEQFETSLQQMQNAILKGQLATGSYTAFNIKDPKPRTIHAAPFEDRVIHHALINKIGARMEQSWVDSSYACRTNMGSHKAIEKAARLCKQYPVLLKMDIRAYFPNINHQTLLKLLKRQFTHTDVFQLIESILASYSTNGVGLPIGALTSQYFANHYLDGFQRWLREQKTVKAEIRYMDDVLVFCESTAHARQIAKLAHNWLEKKRQLQLKPVIIQYSHTGVEFCGFKVSDLGIGMGLRRKRNIKQRIQQLFKAVDANRLSQEEAQQQSHSIRALAMPGEHRHWLRCQMAGVRQNY